MEKCSVDLKTLLRDPFFRCDVSNTFMHQKNDFTGYYRLSDFITFIETGKPIAREDYSQHSENVHFLVRNISEGKPLYEDLLYITDEKAEELAGFRIQKGDVVIAISSNCGSAFLYDGERNENITLSHYLCRIRVDSSRLRPEYLVQYLSSSKIRNYFRGVETGKTQKNLSKVYIRDLPVFLPTIEKQDALCQTIATLEKKITQIKESILSPQSLIDGIFQREFSFDYETFAQLKEKSVENVSVKAFGYNQDLRFSAKFHREAGSYVMSQLTDITGKKIKHFISEPIVLGASISPDDFDESGSAYYVSMATIKTLDVELDEAQLGLV